jgi:hypothetical protein
MIHAYIAVRAECEAVIESARLNCDSVRPRMCSGLGTGWPYLLMPVYRVAEWLPLTRTGARQLGLVTLEQMLNALTCAMENPVVGIRLRACSKSGTRPPENPHQYWCFGLW